MNVNHSINRGLDYITLVSLKDNERFFASYDNTVKIFTIQRDYEEGVNDWVRGVNLNSEVIIDLNVNGSIENIDVLLGKKHWKSSLLANELITSLNRVDVKQFYNCVLYNRSKDEEKNTDMTFTLSSNCGHNTYLLLINNGLCEVKVNLDQIELFSMGENVQVLHCSELRSIIGFMMKL